MTREELMKLVSNNVLRRIGHEPSEWQASTNPLFNSIAHSECIKPGCGLVFGMKQFNEFYSMFVMKIPNYENIGIIEITFTGDKDESLDMEQRIMDELYKNRSLFLLIPKNAYCSTMQNFI